MFSSQRPSRPSSRRQRVAWRPAASPGARVAEPSLRCRLLTGLLARLTILVSYLPAGALSDRLLDRLAARTRRPMGGPPLPPGGGAAVREGGVPRALALGWVSRRGLRRLEPAEVLVQVDREDEVVPAVNLLLAKGDPEEWAWDLVALFEEEGAAGEWEELASGRPDEAGREEAGSDQPAPPRPRLTAAFLTVARSAAWLPPSTAEPLLLACLRVARRRVDPYQPRRHVLLARHAAANLVAEHPELDSALHHLFTGEPGEPLLGVVATGLRQRRTGRTYGVADVLAAWRPGVDRARLFTRAADSLLGSSSRRGGIRRRHSGRHWQGPLLHALAELAAVAAAPLLALAGGLAAVRWLTIDPPTTPNLGTALTLLGLLFGVDVWATEQTGIRLPGSLARHVNRTRSLHAAYSGVLTMTAGVFLGGLLPSIRQAASWATLVAIGYFVASAVLVLRSYAAGLEPGQAAASVVSLRRAAVVWAGSRFGRIQRRAMEIRRQAAALAHVRLVVTPPMREGSAVLPSRRRGFFLPSPRAMRRLLRRRPWRDGSLTLHLSRDVGRVVRTHTRVAVVTSDAGSRLERREVRRVRRLLATRSAAAIDQVAETAAVLLHLAGKLLDEADQQGADRVAQALVQLVEDHLSGVHATQRVTPGVRPPSVPLLESLLKHLVAGAVASTSGSALAFRTQLTNEVLSWTRAQDGAPGLLLAAVRREERRPLDPEALDSEEEGWVTGWEGGDESGGPAPSPEAGLRRQAVAEMLRLAAIHALELQDVDGLLPILDEMGARALRWRGAEGTGSGVHLAAPSEIVATAMDLHPSAALILWRWFARLADWRETTAGQDPCPKMEDDQAQQDQARQGRRERPEGAPGPALVAAARVGAAALEAGKFSIALEVAICLSRRMEDGPEAVRGALESPTYLRREAIRSERRGGYLGERPADVILRFARFVGRLTPAIT